MKLSLTKKVAEDIIAKSLQFLPVFHDAFKGGEPLDVEITAGPAPVPPNNFLYEAVQLVRRHDYKASGKIAAIKALREFAAKHNQGLGLAEAKEFVEALA